MLPSQNRLTRRQDFSEVKAKGRVEQARSFAIAILDREDNNPSRFGFVVSKKISKAAVQRNKARRLLREAVKSMLEKVELGKDIIFLTKQGIVGRSPKEVAKEVRETFAKLNIIK